MDVQTIVGSICVMDEEIILFPEGLLGFPDFKKYIFVSDPKDDVFMWLQSCDRREVAFPVIEAGFITDVSQFKLSASDRMKLGLDPGDSGNYYCIVRVASETTGMTANLKAPIVINKKDHVGYQLVMSDKSLQAQHPVFDALRHKVNEDVELL